ncbi:XPG N-terminal domain and XPG I-region domain containing protein, putative [Babesia bigemina]|uniref:Flap endonuclease 1 n=1 Tax=Babesia bigemina TaxID=5866 RepID=A0A061D6H6_BABBI|nr:XPG N-terminal domain and XPG I-region domain containing protein, putative [Babesia bigemina]CDR96158.1 XPG N-terminal domain and XPG I-region domain containing protein, putative [Babesia bigemina]|eukprot:XP_012768344.1 XPG N-terminal domain and XPG I-region domain containing protein, putative [Babesia bigemina]
MGIKGLIGFLNEFAPGSLSNVTLDSVSGYTVAIDASTALYQFTIAIRESSYFSSLTNSKGESTSHLAGLMTRTIRLLESGIKPIFVFDSTPPEAKLQTLAKRKELRQEAEASLELAKENDDKENIKKFVGRTVHISKSENESAKELLRLMGIPVIEAKEEAEAQCAYLVKQGLADAVGTEDADALVFGCVTLLKNLTASNKKILKVELAKVLELLNLTHAEFIDFCILCGCDYCGTIKGVGPKTAYNLIRKFKSIERILEVKSESLEGYEVAQEYFRNPQVNHIAEIPRSEPDLTALKEFLVDKNDFAEERVNKFLERLLKAKTKKVQLSLRTFFTKPSVPQTASLSTSCSIDDSEGVPEIQEPPESAPLLTTCRIEDNESIPVTKEAPEEDDKHVKRVEKPSMGLLSVCPSHVRAVKKRHVRRFEKPVPIDVDEETVPEHLKRFICVRHFEPRVTIKRTSPREVDAESVEALVSHLCGAHGVARKDAVTPEEECAMSGEGLLWPNPLLQNLRASTGNLSNPRLRDLWQSSSSHGISWDALDKLYMSFREARDSSIAEWDKHAPEVADFASKVARDKITRWCKDSNACPPRLLRMWTHLLYTRWRERYLHIYSTRMLSRFLKGEITDRVLMRELNECTGSDTHCSELPFTTKASEHNPHFVHRVAKGVSSD